MESEGLKRKLEGLDPRYFVMPFAAFEERMEYWLMVQLLTQELKDIVIANME